MATNPIQRRSRQSFLVGFLIALIIMAVVVVLLFMKISSLNEELESAQKEKDSKVEKVVYVAADDIKSGDKITADYFIEKSVKTDIDVSTYLTLDFFEYDEEGKPIEYIAKVDIPYDSIVLPSMLVKDGEEIRDDERIIEYNMIVLLSLNYGY